MVSSGKKRERGKGREKQIRMLEQGRWKSNGVRSAKEVLYIIVRRSFWVVWCEGDRAGKKRRE